VTQTITPGTSDQWKAGEDVMNTVKDLIAKYHPRLAVCDDEIAVVFREKASTSGGEVVLGKTAKAPKLLGVLGEVDFKFTITLGADEWEKLADEQRVALLDHHLCCCGVEENATSGAVKYFLRLPVSVFKEEVERHGWWRTSGKEAPADLIQDLFGD